MTNSSRAEPEPDPNAGRSRPIAVDFDAVGEAKRLLRSIRSATLATLTEAGGPFATLTQAATDYDGAPILLMSRLAAHRRNLERDPRCSLLLAQGGRGDPLAHPRLTLEARAEQTSDASARGRFLRRNPKAALYADFPDFAFWRLEIVGAHLNGGFARAADLAPPALMTSVAGAEALIASEEEILARLNGARADLVKRLAPSVGAWRASGVDPEGIDLVAGDLTERIAFTRRASTPDELDALLIELDGARAGGA
jgi:putative heme iron utilization protein